MSHPTAVLEGSCDCGRNKYAIYVPRVDSEDQPEIRVESSSRSLRANAPPASIFLRVPLSWLHSTTFAFFPDETHSQIRRSYTPRHDPASKRFFCGVCAELLSVWTEEPAVDAGYAHVNWHTLVPASIDELDGLGLLPDGELSKSPTPTADEADNGTASAPHGSNKESGGVIAPRSPSTVPPVAVAMLLNPNEIRRSVPWFDTLLEGSALGRMRRRMGGGTSADGRTHVEWEVVEYGDIGVEVGHTPERTAKLGAKRKIDDGEEDDVRMRDGTN